MKNFNDKMKVCWARITKLPWWIGSPIALPALRDKSQNKRFATVSKQYNNLCKQLDPQNNMSDRHAEKDGLHPWKCHTENIKNAFSNSLPMDFLRNPLIGRQMVAQAPPDIIQQKIKFIESVWSREKLPTILREDYIGIPRIANFKYCTSGNRLHHACHLASYKSAIGKEFWLSPNIAEWGGGYGNMAHLVRRMNPECTYTIIDLPELSALQYIYLYSLIGDDVSLITPEISCINKRKVNLVPVGRVLSGEICISPDAFLSTWAITESPRQAQQFVCRNSFFGADSILLAYHDDSHNYMKEHLPKFGFITNSVPLLPPKHYYSFI